jgi:hypothetical protein
MNGVPSYAASLQPFLLLDKNQFRNSNGKAAANAIVEAKAQNCQVLVIDTVFVEVVRSQTQGKDWKDQFEKDFRDWTQQPELLSVSQGLGELLRLERDSGTPALSSLVDDEMTRFLRDAVKELAISGKAGLAKYDTRVAAALARLTAPGAMLDPARNLAELHTMVDFWHEKKMWLDQDAIKKMIQAEAQDKSASDYCGIALAATSDGVLSGLEDALAGQKIGYPRDVAHRLMSAPSFTLFVWTAREALALYYYALGRKSAQLTDADEQLNQTLDTVYLGYGLACRQLITAEKVVQRLDGGFRRALGFRWP